MLDTHITDFVTLFAKLDFELPLDCMSNRVESRPCSLYVAKTMCSCGDKVMVNVGTFPAILKQMEDKLLHNIKLEIIDFTHRCGALLIFKQAHFFQCDACHFICR